MKKFFIICCTVLLMISAGAVQCAFASSPDEIQKAIDDYKDENYLGCISGLKIYLEEDPSNVVAWYYLGVAYMKISMKPEAHEAFDKVVEINSVPKLTSYSIQAKICMENSIQCTYKEFTNSQIKDLRANPAEFLSQYHAKLNAAGNKSKDVQEIEKLIQGGYGNNVHPDAQNFIIQQKTQTKQSEMNSADKAALPSDDKTAQAEMIMRQYGNNDALMLAMFLDGGKDGKGNKSSNEYYELLKYYQQDNKNINPEMIKYSLQETMLPDF